MRNISTLLIATVLSAQALAQWTPLGSSMLSNRSLCALNDDLYCATFPNGVKKSAGGIGPWTAMNTGLPQSGANYFVQSVGTDGTHLYAGTESGIYRSATGGAEPWSPMNGTLTASSSVYANKFFHFDGQLLAVFAGSIAQGGGIHRTVDNGANWLVGHSGMGSNVAVNHVTKVDDVLWASTSVGLYVSVDNAQNWLPVASVNYSTFSLASTGDRLVIASSFGIRYSTDNGNIWSDANGDPASATDAELIAFDGQLYAVFNSPTGCLRSTDDGSSWSDFNDGFSDVDEVSQEEFLATGNTLYCTALFDIYSITGTGMDITAPASHPSVSAYPAVFDEGFMVRHAAPGSQLQLIDASGRIAMRMALVAAEQWIPRRDLAGGSYQALVRDPHQRSIALGILIAR